METLHPRPWRPSSLIVGVGCGFADHLEIVVDANGDTVCTIDNHYVTEFIPGCREIVGGITRRIRRKDMYPYRPVFTKGQRFPHSETATLIASLNVRTET